MDPLSLATGVLALAGTVLTIVTKTNSYLTSVRAASEDARTFCAELALLKDILAQLKGNLDDGTLPPSRFGDDSVLVVSLKHTSTTPSLLAVLITYLCSHLAPPPQ